MLRRLGCLLILVCVEIMCVQTDVRSIFFQHFAWSTNCTFGLIIQEEVQYIWTY